MANDLVVQVETEEYNALLDDANRYRYLRERTQGDSRVFIGFRNLTISMLTGETADDVVDEMRYKSENK